MDVFRIFDCFNIVESMLVSINAVLKANKVAEVCICYTGNVLTSKVYNLEYYKELAKEIKGTGAHILGVKDMAGLLRPLEVAPLMKVLREAVGDMPIHFHTHATSSGYVFQIIYPFVTSYAKVHSLLVWRCPGVDVILLTLRLHQW